MGRFAFVRPIVGFILALTLAASSGSAAESVPVGARGLVRPHDRKAHHDGADYAILTQSLPQENPNALDTSTD